MTSQASIFLMGLQNFHPCINWGNRYSLVYGIEAVLPIKVGIQSLRVLVETKVLEEDWVRERYE